MIIYMLKDGLGNQLFEYAYAKKLQEHLGDQQIAFCTYLFNLKNFSLNGTRSSSLHYFNLPEDVIILSGFKNFYYFICFLLRLLFVYQWDFVSWLILKRKIHRDKKFVSDCKKGIYVTQNTFEVPNDVFTRRKNKYVFGNYEGIGALPRDVTSLQRELQITKSPSEANGELLDKIRSTNSVCVHIRRGDYLNKGNERLQVCDMEYYVNAVKYIDSHLESPTYYIFSNTHEDIEYIRKNFRLGITPVYVDLSNPDYEEFRLMCSCKHFIISNSTFSWWASLLSENADKVVVAPSRWTNLDEHSESMFRDEFVFV